MYLEQKLINDINIAYEDKKATREYKNIQSDYYEMLSGILISFVKKDLQSLDEALFNEYSRKLKGKTHGLSASTIRKVITQKRKVPRNLLKLLSYFAYGLILTNNRNYESSRTVPNTTSMQRCHIVPFFKTLESNPIIKRVKRDFIDKSGFDAAIAWINSNWSSYKCWELLLLLLDLYDKKSNPIDGLNALLKYRYDIEFYPDEIEYQEALKYLLGRLLTQKGFYKDAQVLHYENLDNKKRYYSYHQILSLFEIASIHYRNENYREALSQFDEITNLVTNLNQFPLLATHIKLYQATLYLIKTIASSIPNSISHRYVECDPKKCLKLADEAFRITESIENPIDVSDKRAWVFGIKGMGFECLGQLGDATNMFSRCEKLITSGKCHKSSAVHLYLYISQFLYRQKKYDEALSKIEDARSVIPPKQRSKIDSKIHEYKSYVYLEQGKKDKGIEHFIKAMEGFFLEDNIELMIDWPIVSRLYRTAKNLGIPKELYYKNEWTTK